MRFHLPALPGQRLVRENSSCAYTQKVRKFADMMVDLDHEVVTYGHEESDSRALHVACYPELSEPVPFDPDAWGIYNAAALLEIAERVEDGDVLGIIAGRCQELLSEELAQTRPVEYGIGYGGVYAPYRVFESYAWMHAVAGAGVADAHTLNGRFYDAVIPNFFEVDEFPAGAGDGDYLLYVGRLTPRKGIDVAIGTAKRTGLELICAGEGEYRPEGATYIGAVGPKERAQLMGAARALIAPTLYLEPFGGVVVEAHLCGTPTITTDWGAFPETVQQGSDGYRCHTMGEFSHAVELVGELERGVIRTRARTYYSTEVIGHRYDSYFGQLATLDEEGFYSDWSGLG